jgi:hypothetical protein
LIVIESGNKVKSEAKTFSSVSVRKCKYFKYLEFSDNVFYYYSIGCQTVVVLFMCFGQRLCFAGFIGQLRMCIELLHPLITTVHLHFVYLMKLYATFFEHPEIMLSAFIHSRADNLCAMAAYYQLAFQGMSFLLT